MSLKKILITSAILSGLGAVITDQVFAPESEMQGKFQDYNVEADGEASLLIDGKYYPTTIDEKTCKSLKGNQNYTFKFKDPYTSGIRVTGIKK